MEDHLSNADIVDPDQDVTESDLDQANERLEYWLRRMLNHKRSQVNHWPNNSLEAFCDDLERVLDATPAIVTS